MTDSSSNPQVTQLLEDVETLKKENLEQERVLARLDSRYELISSQLSQIHSLIKQIAFSQIENRLDKIESSIESLSEAFGQQQTLVNLFAGLPRFLQLLLLFSVSIAFLAWAFNFLN